MLINKTFGVFGVMFSELVHHILYSHCLTHDIRCGKHYYINMVLVAISSETFKIRPVLL